MKKIYLGTCHCGAVRFSAEIDIAAGTEKCNCSLCAKSRSWTARVWPEAFGLLAGEAELSDYRGQNPVAHHPFCRRCGVRAFAFVDAPNLFGRPYANVNLACLDGVDVDELMAAPITYRDGRNDAWGGKAGRGAALVMCSDPGCSAPPAAV